jgi:hypothetical protein
MICGAVYEIKARQSKEPDMTINGPYHSSTSTESDWYSLHVELCQVL